MSIRSIEYFYNEYATTNPPRNICKMVVISVTPDGTVSIKAENSVTGYSNIKEKIITQEQFQKIIDLLFNLRIIVEIKKEIANRQFEIPPMPMCGGSITSSFTVTSDEETITANRITENMNKIIKSMYELIPEINEPVNNDTNSAYMYGSIAPEQINSHPAFSAPADAYGEWTCPNCGKINNNKFCTGCGTPRQ